MGSLKEDLQLISALPNEPATELLETSTSWVFLTQSEAFKVKKPVSLGFLDYSTLELRKSACEAEIRLNARLAPGVYRGLEEVRRSSDGQHTIGGEGKVVDWAVRMVRLDDELRADRLLEAGYLTFEHIDQLAKQIHRFHNPPSHGLSSNGLPAISVIDEKFSNFGSQEIIESNLLENFEQASHLIQDYITVVEMREIQDWQLHNLNNHKKIFKKRVKDNFIREGHGDIRLDHIYFLKSGEIKIIDCIEFNERFRYADVASDLAYLTMDLKYYNRKDLAERLAAQYVTESNDFDLYQVLDFYENYRAYTRGKVCANLAINRSVSTETAKHAAVQAHHYFLLAYSLMKHPPKLPTLIAVGGTIAAGKTTVSNELSKILLAPVIASDRTRKSLLKENFETPVHNPLWQGAYSEKMTEQVYREMMEKAKSILQTGRSVILDASFRKTSYRETARRLAMHLNIPFYFIECQVSSSEAQDRLTDRSKNVSISDGRVEIFKGFTNRYENISEIPVEEHLVINTSESLDVNLSEIKKRIENIRYFAAS